MYESVLFPTDGSKKSQIALEHAVSVARRNDSTVHVVHVVELGEGTESLEQAEFDETIQRVEQAGEDAVEAALDRIPTEEIDTEATVLQGNATEEILNYIETREIEIVVMGTYRREPSARKVIGSVAENVVQASPVPVLTVKVDQDSKQDPLT